MIGSSTGTTVAGEANGPGGTSLNQLKNPACILLDSSGGIFISDSGNNRVQYWSNGASTGTTVAGSSIGESMERNKKIIFYKISSPFTGNLCMLKVLLAIRIVHSVIQLVLYVMKVLEHFI